MTLPASGSMAAASGTAGDVVVSLRAELISVVIVLPNRNLWRRCAFCSEFPSLLPSERHHERAVTTAAGAV